jgi:outer membrane protein OmpA-like peptidoglycan-associated protein
MLRNFRLLLALVVALMVSTFAMSQEAPKYEVFGGYSWYNAGGNVPATANNDSTHIQDFKKGWAGQFTYDLNRWAGIAIDANGHYGDFGNAHSLAVGPQFKLRLDGITPFGEALLGWQRFGPKLYPDQNTAVFMVGGGLEYPVHPRVSIRFFQVDYVNSYYTKLSSGSSNNLNGVRLQGGVVFNLGLAPQEGKVSAACSAEPTAVDAGVPVKVSITPTGFLPKRTLTYTYAANAGTKIASTGNTATVETAGLAPGSYLVNGKVVDNGKGEHQQTASCQVGFSINEPPKHPPVLAVSAKPTSLMAGDAATITASGSSPDNRPLSYSCKANAGRLTGNGPTYTLDTAGVQGGNVTVNCTVSDDRNLTATANTSVQVTLPPPPPVAKDFGQIKFEHDVKRPTRVDNEAKGELDRYADALAASPDAKGVVVGYATPAENTPKKGSKKAPEFAAERAVNTKDYLTKEKGIDPTRIEPRIGNGDDQKTELWIVPAGASFPAAGTEKVDEAKVKAIPRVAPPAEKAHKAHKAHKAVKQS